MTIDYVPQSRPTAQTGRRSPLAERIAAAPISWGVCEVPWGYQIPRERVLNEMQQLGVRATEFGPDGYLPDDGAECSELLQSYGLQAIGGFVPVVLHDSAIDPVPAVDRAMGRFEATGAGVLVLAAATGLNDYDARPALEPIQWANLLRNLDVLETRARDRGIKATLHPHIGTMIEDGNDVLRVLDGSSISLCVDTGHLMAADTMPLRVIQLDPSRVAHVHLKDVAAGHAARMRSGAIAYGDAVADGMYVPLGEGDAEIVSIIETLEASGYDGWYVMEQDVILREEPDGDGPLPGIRQSLDFLLQLAGD